MSFKNQKKNASPTATRHPFPVDILFRFPFILSMCSVLTLAMAESVLFRPLINVTFPAAKICPSDTDNALGAAGGRENQTTFGRYHRASLKRRKRVRARERERERERERKKKAPRWYWIPFQSLSRSTISPRRLAFSWFICLSIIFWVAAVRTRSSKQSLVIELWVLDIKLEIGRRRNKFWSHNILTILLVKWIYNQNVKIYDGFTCFWLKYTQLNDRYLTDWEDGMGGGVVVLSKET